jgi:hypothetical protein
MPRKVVEVVIVEAKEGRFIVKTYSDGLVERELIVKSRPRNGGTSDHPGILYLESAANSLCDGALRA